MTKTRCLVRRNGLPSEPDEQEEEAAASAQRARAAVARPRKDAIDLIITERGL
jgi:hypothetical protein